MAGLLTSRSSAWQVKVEDMESTGHRRTVAQQQRMHNALVQTLMPNQERQPLRGQLLWRQQQMTRRLLRQTCCACASDKHIIVAT